jgi:hypothetical protein
LLAEGTIAFELEFGHAMLTETEPLPEMPERRLAQEPKRMRQAIGTSKRMSEGASPWTLLRDERVLALFDRVNRIEPSMDEIER